MPEIIRTSKRNKKACKPIFVYAFCSARGIALTLIILSVGAAILLNNSSFTFFIRVVIYLSLGIGALLSGYCAHRRLKGRGMVNGSVAALFYFLLFVIITVILLRFNIKINIVYILPLVLLGGITGGIISANK